MKTSEKILTNNSVGLYTMVKDLDDNTYCLFTTKDRHGNLRESGWYRDEELALANAGYLDGLNKEEYDCSNLQIIRTIHPSELMGPGYEVGQKVRIKPNAKEECEKINLIWHGIKGLMAKDGFGFIEKTDCGAYSVWNKDRSSSYLFAVSALEPYFEDEEAVEVLGVKYSKADIEALVKSAKDLKPLE